MNHSEVARRLMGIAHDYAMFCRNNGYIEAKWHRSHYKMLDVLSDHYDSVAPQPVAMEMDKEDAEALEELRRITPPLEELIARGKRGGAPSWMVERESPQPVAMEAVVRCIAEQMTDMGEHYSPEDEEWQEVFEVNAGLIRTVRRILAVLKEANEEGKERNQ